MEPFLDPAQTVKDLRDAANFLKNNPWGQGADYSSSSGRFCAHGALRYVVGGLVMTEENARGRHNLDDVALAALTYGYESEQAENAKRLRDRTSNASRAFYRVLYSDITTYNDVDGRTKEQMITALETVAARIEENPNRA